jgi:hypothetical protein
VETNLAVGPGGILSGISESQYQLKKHVGSLYDKSRVMTWALFWLSRIRERAEYVVY